VRFQFEAQSRAYAQYEGADFRVIERAGEPVGRLYVARWPKEIRIVDIAIVPAHRNEGIGTALLRELLGEGARVGQRVSIHVERFNPARALYERLGFAEDADAGTEVYALMVAQPKTA
jgi:ribosomal protein S18 acetylase RimI-like enzyme